LPAQEKKKPHYGWVLGFDGSEQAGLLSTTKTHA